jgi:hypothetical protein
MRYLAILCLLLWSADTRAGEMNGNELLELCQSNPSFTTGYVTGLIESSSRAYLVVLSRYSATPLIRTDEEAHAWVARLKAAENEILGYCIPQGATRVQSKDVVCRYLQDNPANRQLSAAFLARAGLSKAWPCTDN